MGILPRRNYEERIKALNLNIARLAGSLNVHYDFIGEVFLQDNGKVNEGLFSDGLHPNLAGYEQMGPALLEVLQK